MSAENAGRRGVHLAGEATYRDVLLLSVGAVTGAASTVIAVQAGATPPVAFSLVAACVVITSLVFALSIWTRGGA